MNRLQKIGLAIFGMLTLFAVNGNAQTVVVPADKALLIVQLPSADASLKIGGYVSNQRGHERLLFSPALVPGFTYWYEVEASWLENGQQKKVVRQVSLQPGQAITVDFRTAIAIEKIGTPKIIDEKIIDKKIIDKKIIDKKIIDKKPVVTEPAAIKERTFLFTYAGAIKDLKPGKTANVWLPVAVSGPEQQVTIKSQKLPGKPKIHTEKQYGNTMLYFQAKANDKGEIPFEIVYEVQRKEVRTDLSANLVLKPAANENLARFLEPDAKVPIVGKPLELIKDKKVPKDQFAAAKVFYDIVNNHMKYSKEGKGWGQGDSVWACDSKFGNCSDFHSLFISMARGNKIPSKFEMGFPIPTKHGAGAVGGYHCWAWFLPNQKGWIPVDISEANRHPELKEYYFGNLTEDRVRFTTGRDINLEPRQKGPALNFFIYPYAEVNGQPYPQEKIERRFAYEDVK